MREPRKILHVPGKLDAEVDSELQFHLDERIRANIEQVAFREGPEGRPQRLTVSVGKVSFPHDGHTDSILLAQAMAYLAQAVDRGGNQVTHSSGNPE